MRCEVSVERCSLAGHIYFYVFCMKTVRRFMKENRRLREHKRILKEEAVASQRYILKLERELANYKEEGNV